MPALDSSAALTQEVQIDLFQGPFDLLLTLLLRDEVDMLELPLADLIEESVTPGSDERWEIDAASQLILLLAAIADLKGRRMLGEDVEDEPDLDALAMREALVARLVAYAPFQRAAEWLLGRDMNQKDQPWLAELAYAFVHSGFSYQALIKAVVTSDRYRRLQ